MPALALGGAKWPPPQYYVKSFASKLSFVSYHAISRGLNFDESRTHDGRGVVSVAWYDSRFFRFHPILVNLLPEYADLSANSDAVF